MVGDVPDDDDGEEPLVLPVLLEPLFTCELFDDPAYGSLPLSKMRGTAILE